MIGTFIRGSGSIIVHHRADPQRANPTIAMGLHSIHACPHAVRAAAAIIFRGVDVTNTRMSTNFVRHVHRLAAKDAERYRPISMVASHAMHEGAVALPKDGSASSWP